MISSKYQKLSRRERQILDILFRLGEATVVEVADQLPDPPGNAAIRKWLSTMEERSLVQHRKQGRSFTYSSKVPIEEVKANSLRQLVGIFFEGCSVTAAAALLEPSQSAMNKGDRSLILNIIEKAEREGR